MRKLSDSFMQCLKTGFLAGIPQTVICDHDLNLEIRENYLNIYFKGNSILKLAQVTQDKYRVTIDRAFTAGLVLPSELVDAASAGAFLENLPALKQNVIRHGKMSMELEYEQMIIRANNFEPRNNSEYFIIDRQYTVPVGRFDLTGIFWDRRRRRKGQEVDLCLMEVKFALNPDIDKVHKQLDRYYNSLQPIAADIAEECESVFCQKLELGLYDQSSDRLAAMKTLRISRDFSRFQFALVLVDYNPNSSKLDLAKITGLSFAKQIRIFHGGFAMWQQNMKPVAESLSRCAR